MLVAEAFALELYFKALKRAVLPEYQDTDHDLWALFNKLPQEVKDSIKNHYNSPYHHDVDARANMAQTGTPTDFDGALKMSKHAFQRMRYSFDYEKGGVNLHDVIIATRNHIFLRHPDWVKEFED